MSTHRADFQPLSQEHELDRKPSHGGDQKTVGSQQSFLREDETAVKVVPVKRHASWSDRLNDWWLWELLSVILSVSCLIALVIILRVYEGRSLPDWPLGITLNTLVAVLSTIMEASMMVPVAACISQLKWIWFRRPNALNDFDSFDMASRGPWGALLLLYRISFKGFVALGALVTILALAMGPFLQQIISFPLRPDSSTGLASIRRAQIYDEGEYYTPFNTGVSWGPGLQTKAAIYRGIFTADVPPVDPFCSTGNCTFPVFDSLAVCSKCQNVTDQTTRSDRQGQGARGPDWWHNSTYSLPGDAEVEVHARYYDGRLQQGPSLVSATNVSATMPKDILGISNPMLSVAILQFPGIDRDGYSANYSKETPIAHECALYFCVQTYNLTVVDGKTTTEVLSTWYNETDPVWSAGSNGHRFLLRPSDQPAPQAPKLKDPIFIVYDATFNTILWFLDKTLHGTALSRTAVVAGQDRIVDDVLEALKVSKDISVLFGNLATSLSNRIREMYVDEADSDVRGETLVMVPHVRIQWAWLSLPALLVAVSSGFLVATMVATTRSRVPVWKNSSLAVLFHGLVHEGESSRHRGRLSHMIGEAEDRRIALRRDGGDDWKLRDST